MSEQDPNLVYSSLNQAIVVDGYRFDIQIYRLEHEAAWVLEVVDYQGTSHVWDDQFATDKEAKAEAVKELAEQGASAFMAGDNVVPFKRPFPTGD